MKIAIEAERANTTEKTGVENYAKQLILHLAKIDLENTYILYLRTKPEKWFLELPKNFQIQVMPFPIFWTQIRLSWELYLHPVDVLFIPASALPIYLPKNSFVTIHDTAWKFFPETFGLFNRIFLNWSTKFAVKNAKKIIAVSESTKKDLLSIYKVDPQKIEVVHHGFYENKIESQGEVELLRKLPKKFILFFSTIQPRKNLNGLIDAFASLKKELPEIPYKLVVVGKLGWKFKDIVEKLTANQENVIFLGYLKNDQAYSVLKYATAMVLPSFYEGFGMTILEAFASKVPVLVSNVSSMPEVAKDAAVYFDPHSIESIKIALKNVITNENLRKELVKKGELQLKNFSWEKCAKQTLEVLLK